MTDIEKFKNLLSDFGMPIGYSEDKFHLQECKEASIKEIYSEEDEITSIELRKIYCSTENKIDGYGDFYTLWDFDKDGKFIKLGIWE